MGSRRKNSYAKVSSVITLDDKEILKDLLELEISIMKEIYSRKIFSEEKEFFSLSIKDLESILNNETEEEAIMVISLYCKDYPKIIIREDRILFENCYDHNRKNYKEYEVVIGKRHLLNLIHKLYYKDKGRRKIIRIHPKKDIYLSV